MATARATRSTTSRRSARSTSNPARSGTNTGTSRSPSSAARGVGARHGDEAFFEFASAAYESQGSYSGEAIGAAAEAAGADPCAAMSDARYATYGEASADDRSEGASMGVEGTPTIFVNGSPVEEGYAAESIAAAIDAEL